MILDIVKWMNYDVENIRKLLKLVLLCINNFGCYWIIIVSDYESGYFEYRGYIIGG